MAAVRAEVIPWLQDRGTEPFLIFGTLLGFVRDGRVIPWDKDVDLGIVAEDASRVRADDLPDGWRLRIESEVYPWMRRYGVTRGNITITNGSTKVGIHLLQRGPDGRRYFTYHRRLDVVPEVLPLEYHDGYAVPADPTLMLEWLYGGTWRTPDPGYVGSPAQRQNERRYVIAR
jgi:hypothetical protein